MTQEQYDKLDRSNVAASFLGAIGNALQIEDFDGAKLLNDTYYEKFPEGNSGLPKGWTPAPPPK